LNKSRGAVVLPALVLFLDADHPVPTIPGRIIHGKLSDCPTVLVSSHQRLPVRLFYPQGY